MTKPRIVMLVKAQFYLSLRPTIQSRMCILVRSLIDDSFVQSCNSELSIYQIRILSRIKKELFCAMSHQVSHRSVKLPEVSR